MKTFFLCLLLLPTLSFALGDLAHNYVAEGAAAQAQSTNTELQNVLTVYSNAYLVGSDYPDTGYLHGFNYGEDSHWPYFVNPFAAYIKTTCSNPTSTDMKAHCDELTAFLLGIATHVKSDIVSHWTYYDYVALNDFGSEDPSDWDKAHSAMDPASDFYVIVRKQIYDHPVVWWVPVNDLVNVYNIMLQNKVITDVVTANEIIEANAIYYVALGLTEDLVAYPVYTYDALYYIPWGIAHLEDPNPVYGAFPEMIRQSALYIEDVWNSIHGQSKLGTIAPRKMDEERTVQFAAFVKKALDDKLITITPETDKYGDVTFTPTSMQFTSDSAKEKYNTELMTLRDQLIAKK